MIDNGTYRFWNKLENEWLEDLGRFISFECFLYNDNFDAHLNSYIKDVLYNNIFEKDICCYELMDPFLSSDLKGYGLVDRTSEGFFLVDLITLKRIKLSSPLLRLEVIGHSYNKPAQLKGLIKCRAA